MVKFLGTELTKTQITQYEKISTMIKDAKPISEINTMWEIFVEGLVESNPPASSGSKIETMKEFDEYIEKLEEQLASAGDDAQLANIDLQNVLQKQQQTLQTMSNVSKILHDTALAVIRKIG